LALAGVEGHQEQRKRDRKEQKAKSDSLDELHSVLEPHTILDAPLPEQVSRGVTYCWPRERRGVYQTMSQFANTN